MDKSIFFDLDGTLWDALLPLTQTMNQTMIAAGKPYRFTPDTVRPFMGLTPEETVPVAFPGMEFSEGLALFKKSLADEVKYLSVHPGKLYPHEEEVLQILSKRYPLYVVSNSDKGYVENYLRSCQMEKYFAGHICAGDTGFPKWKNIVYLREKEKISQVIYIGDTLKDRIESEKAGVLFIHAAYGFGAIPDEPHAIASLAELPEMAARLFKE
jgi:phosphoglycolate phosphatase